MPVEHPLLYIKWILRPIPKGGYMFIYLINSIQKPGESVAFKREKQCSSTKTKRNIIRPNLSDCWTPGALLAAYSKHRVIYSCMGRSGEQSHRVCKWKATSAGAARQIASFGRSLLNIYPLQKSWDIFLTLIISYWNWTTLHRALLERCTWIPAVTPCSDSSGQKEDFNRYFCHPISFRHMNCY